MKITRFLDALEDLGMRSASSAAYWFQVGVAVIIIANVTVTVYGFREKCRFRKGIFHHISWEEYDLPCFLKCISCCVNPCFVKFLFKTAVHLTVLFSLVVSVGLALYVELMWIIFLAIHASCEVGGDAVGDLLNLV